MGNQIQFNQFTIQDLFNNFYQIPDYQREYVWEEKHVVQLLDDINDSFSDSYNAEYFLGSIVVCQINEKQKYEVIDGQQRLITLSLLINNFRRLLMDNKVYSKLLYTEKVGLGGNNITSYVVDINYEGKEIFYDLIKSANDDQLDIRVTEGLPGETIYNAHRTIYYWLDQNFRNNEEQVKKFAGYFLNKVIIIQIQTPEIGNALKIFETINERGVSLDQVDLLKNLLFQNISRDVFSSLQAEWEKFKKSIIGEVIKEKPLRFLRYFIMANYDIEKDEQGNRILREDEIYSWLIKNKTITDYEAKPFDFVRKLQENSSFYMELIKDRHGDNLNTNLSNISKIVGNGFKQQFILLLSAKGLDSELFNHLLLQLETLLFYYNITKEPPRDIEKRFSLWAEDLRKIKNKSDLNDFITSRVKPDIKNRESLYQQNFSNLKITSMQKYKIKYLLGKIATFIESERIGELGFQDISPYTKKSIHIEHILPDVPEKELLDEFCKGRKNDYSEYKTKLGNLTLLERPINDSIQRDYFSKKSIEYCKSNIYLTKSIVCLDNVGTDTSINRINSKLHSYTKWDRDSINDRQQMLYELSKLVWRIDTL